MLAANIYEKTFNWICTEYIFLYTTYILYTYNKVIWTCNIHTYYVLRIYTLYIYHTLYKYIDICIYIRYY